MDYKKIIEMRKKNIKLEEDFEENLKNFINKSKDKIKQVQSELSEAINNKFKRDIYSEILSIVENMIIERNVTLTDAGKLQIVKHTELEQSYNISIKRLISMANTKGVDLDVYIEDEEYIDNIFHLIRIYFSKEKDLDVFSDGNILTIMIK